MIASFSFGCSRVDPLAGDTHRQMTMDADRKMYRYKLMHRVQQPKDNDALQRPIVDQLPCNDRVFQAISMSSETRYPFILNLDTGESQWSVNAVRDFDLPSSTLLTRSTCGSPAFIPRTATTYAPSSTW